MRTSEMPHTDTVEPAPAAPTLEPYLMKVHDDHVKTIDAIVERLAVHLGEKDTASVRVMVERSLITRGIDSLKRESWYR